MAQTSSAAVRSTTYGLVTCVPPMANVMVTQTEHVDAFKLFPQMDSIVSQYAIKVSSVITHRSRFECPDSGLWILLCLNAETVLKGVAILWYHVTYCVFLQIFQLVLWQLPHLRQVNLRSHCWYNLIFYFQHDEIELRCPIFLLFSSIAALPLLYEYLISVELNVSEVAVINQLRSILSNITYPISINDHTRLSQVNISTGKNTESAIL